MPSERTKSSPPDSGRVDVKSGNPVICESQNNALRWSTSFVCGATMREIDRDIHGGIRYECEQGHQITIEQGEK